MRVSISSLLPVAAYLSLASGVAASSNSSGGVETRTLEQIYAAAIAEGGQLNIRFGGDEKNQQDGTVAGFLAKFPKINVTWTVDVSKYHDSVIDRSLAINGTAGTDIAILQTLHDFPRWKDEGVLLQYKPLGYNQLFDYARTGDGYFAGLFHFYFGPTYSNAAFVNGTGAPRDFSDFNKPEFKGHIVSTWPNDDDAVLYQHYLLVQQYGWPAVLNYLKNQNILFVRGTATPWEEFSRSNATVSFTTAGGANGTTILPTTTRTIVWPQTGAIFKSSKNQESAKLFLSYLLSPEFQTGPGWRWPVRADLPVAAGQQPLSNLTHILDPAAFGKFMLDRATVERYRFQFEQLLNTPQGLSPLVDNIF